MEKEAQICFGSIYSCFVSLSLLSVLNILFVKNPTRCFLWLYGLKLSSFAVSHKSVHLATTPVCGNILNCSSHIIKEHSDLQQFLVVAQRNYGKPLHWSCEVGVIPSSFPNLKQIHFSVDLQPSAQKQIQCLFCFYIGLFLKISKLGFYLQYQFNKI